MSRNQPSMAGKNDFRKKVNMHKVVK
jgi:hypothetical protein